MSATPKPITRFRPGSILLLTKSSLSDESVAHPIGSLVAGVLNTSDSCTLHYRRGHVVLAHEDDVVILSELPEDLALRVMLLLSKTDEDLGEHIKRREAFQKASAEVSNLT
jgi:hypothetical protein